MFSFSEVISNTSVNNCNRSVTVFCIESIMSFRMRLWFASIRPRYNFGPRKATDIGNVFQELILFMFATHGAMSWPMPHLNLFGGFQLEWYFAVGLCTDPQWNGVVHKGHHVFIHVYFLGGLHAHDSNGFLLWPSTIEVFGFVFVFVLLVFFGVSFTPVIVHMSVSVCLWCLYFFDQSQWWFLNVCF